MREFARACAISSHHLSRAALFLLLALIRDAAFAAEPTMTVSVTQKDGAFIVDTTIDVPVPLATAWAVLTDFDNMTSIIGNLKSSKVVSREANTLIVKQSGVASHGLLSFAFESEREIRLEPMKRILARSLSGTVKRMESESRISEQAHGVQIKYHAESLPDSILARMFGASFVRHEVEEQFLELTKEMMRRRAVTDSAGGAAAPPVAK